MTSKPAMTTRPGYLAAPLSLSVHALTSSMIWCLKIKPVRRMYVYKQCSIFTKIANVFASTIKGSLSAKEGVKYVEPLQHIIMRLFALTTALYQSKEIVIPIMLLMQRLLHSNTLY